MAKIPYMKFYIGDWEQDMNACEIKTEGAWLKIVVKMFKNNQSGVYKTSTKALQNLWKSNPAEVKFIIEDLLLNDICDIDMSVDFIEFRNRRMIKEKDISNKRSNAVQNRYKVSTKQLLNPEYEYEHDNELIFSKNNSEELKNEILNSNQWIESSARLYKVTLSFCEERLKFFLDDQTQKEALEGKSTKEVKGHFCNWIKLQEPKESGFTIN